MIRHLVFLKNLIKFFPFLDSLLIVIGIKVKSVKIYLPISNETIFIRKKSKDKETFKEIFFRKIYNIDLPISPISIIDAGANTGFASLFFKLKYPNSNIVALEIDDDNCKMIHQNLKNKKSIEIIKKGLFNKHSYFKIEDPYNATNSLIIRNVDNKNDYDVESITVADIMENKGWNHIDLVKIDIEGSEKDVFESNYENWLPKTKIIMIETHDRMVEKCSFTVMKALDKFNFILYTTTDGGTLVFYNKDLIDNI